MALASALEPLTGQQRHFVQAFVELGVGAQAAREAGYSEASAAQRARELLDKPHIEAAIAEVREIARKRSHISIDRLLVELYGVYERARELDKLDTANRSLELMMKHLGAFPRPEVSIDARQQVLQLPSGLSIDELRQLARGDVAQLPEGDTPDHPSLGQSEVDVMQSSGIDSPAEQEPSGDATET